jgi:hypothetical protein
MFQGLCKARKGPKNHKRLYLVMMFGPIYGP